VSQVPEGDLSRVHADTLPANSPETNLFVLPKVEPKTNMKNNANTVNSIAMSGVGFDIPFKLAQSFQAIFAGLNNDDAMWVANLVMQMPYRDSFYDILKQSMPFLQIEKSDLKISRVWAPAETRYYTLDSDKGRFVTLTNSSLLEQIYTLGGQAYGTPGYGIRIAGAPFCVANPAGEELLKTSAAANSGFELSTQNAQAKKFDMTLIKKSNGETFGVCFGPLNGADYGQYEYPTVTDQ
jgi:hypothetical protein